MTLHGKSRSKEYTAWRNMITRCNSPRSSSYRFYGARGIRVCERWRHSFENFVADMGKQPGPNYTLERTDSNGSYTPENCRWATYREQALNRSITQFIEFQGKTLCLTDWAHRLGIKRTTLRARINQYRWPLERALTEGARPYVTNHKGD